MVLAPAEISISAEVIRGFFHPGGVSGLGAEGWETSVPICFQERKASKDGGASAVGEDGWSRVSREDGDPIGLTFIFLTVLGEV